MSNGGAPKPQFHVLGCRGALEGTPEHHAWITLAVAADILRSRVLEDISQADVASLPLHQTAEWPGRNGTSWLVTRVT
ncbi:hypothetical protein [Conexibacter sp. CPCC 206217]|uniref:hypothetical protein n=1 Tax=Conexibacter sp. CPCC 206217 TaxID=3064574 RepID=UPI002728D837|nr:hypothetical protein [Conexibacter sp. CPCC 206217]MDO8208858.1 hypothetical protein [Conexibacter sp. CPCC 206217]